MNLCHMGSTGIKIRGASHRYSHLQTANVLERSTHVCKGGQNDDEKKVVPVRLGYADPPYIGNSCLYKDHPDYNGEVDHRKLIAKLESEFDGWILHASSPSIPEIARWTPPTARWGAWVKSFAAFKKGVRPAYAWEPVIFKPMRKMAESYTGQFIQRDWIEAPITMQRGFIGAKPEAVCHWAFEIVGAEPADELIDLFPGSGAVSRAWTTWRPQLGLIFQEALRP